jgi:hypothetical protein
MPTDKYKAQTGVTRAIAKGLLIRPKECELCGATGLIHAHHHKGYEPENALDVQWLCPKCHRREHPHDPIRKGMKRGEYGHGRNAIMSLRLTSDLAELLRDEAIEKNLSISVLIRSILVAEYESRENK